MTANIREIAHEIDEGWRELEQKGLDLRQIEAAAGPQQPIDPHKIGRRYVTHGDIDIATEVDQALAVTAHNARGDLIRIAVTTARATIQEQQRAWFRAYESQVCEQLHEQRLEVARRARKLTPALVGVGKVDDLAGRLEAADAFVKIADVLRDFDALRQDHLALIAVPVDERNHMWRGVDWVANYREAWPDFFLVRGVDVIADGGLLIHSRGPIHAPWEQQDALERLRQIARVEIWTPTLAKLRTAIEEIDLERLRGIRDFQDDYRRTHPQGQRSMAPVPNPVTTYDRLA